MVAISLAKMELPAPWRTYLCFCAFRILNVMLIQSQFDPDEYWQNLEPAYCFVFQDQELGCKGLTWEWKRRNQVYQYGESMPWSPLFNDILYGPVRSYASVLPTICFYKAIRYLHLDSAWMISRGPVYMYAVCVASLTDWTVWYMARAIEPTGSNRRADTKRGSLAWWSCYCMMTSWFNAYTMVRTYSNSLETLLLVLALALLCPELLGSKQHQPRQTTRACLAFFLGGLSSSIRFTSLAAFVPLGLLSSTQYKSIKLQVGFLLGVCALFGLLGFLSTVLIDRYCYGFWAIPIMGNIHFNVLEGKGSLYGTHPPYWYLTAGLPAITGVLVPFLLVALVSPWSPASRRLWIIVFSYVVLHSFSEHKEFRFLLPILPLCCILSGTTMRAILAERVHVKFLLSVFALANFVAIAFLGLFHQSAPVSINHAILRRVDTGRQVYSIHFLLGCHSVPLLSHLHSPPVQFETWALDCGPVCRADDTVECESDSFLRDPGSFMDLAYGACGDASGEAETCTADPSSLSPLPDFMVLSTDQLPQMRTKLVAMGMVEVGRFPQSITGITMRESVPENINGGNEKQTTAEDDAAFLEFGNLQVQLEQLLLYESKIPPN